LAERLLELDIECHYQVSVRDHAGDMDDAFRRSLSRSDVVLVSGGLGPTRDDITSEVLARTTGRELVLDEASLEAIRTFFHDVGREMSESNVKQALFPAGAEVLPNPIGTAPGFMLEEQVPVTGGGASRRVLVFCLPGVPRELARMLDEQVLPRIGARLVGPERPGATVCVRARLLRTFGMGESSLETELKDLARDGDVEIGFRTAFPDNYLRVVARGDSAATADARIAAVVAAVRERLGPLVYGEGEETLPAVVGGLLRERGATVAVAESCTGGLVAERITDVPGASQYFRGGVVAYANEAKQALLGVPAELLARHGAVSEAVARAMAEGVRARFAADIGIATTGISGPTGGTAEKPVGLVYLALARAEGTTADGFVFPIDRLRHRMLTAQVALDWLRRALLGFELTGPSLLRRQGGGPPPTGSR